MRHLTEKVSQITGKDIDYHVMVDFAGFRELVDRIDGIEVDVPERIYDNEYP